MHTKNRTQKLNPKIKPKKFEPNIQQSKSTDLQPLFSQNQHQSPSWKPIDPPKHNIRSNLETQNLAIIKTPKPSKSNTKNPEITYK